MDVDWTLRSWTADGTQHEAVGLQAPPSLRLTPDGQLHGTDGCNIVAGPARIDGDRLVTGQLRSTMRWCGEDVERTARVVRAVLGAGPTWTVADGLLELTDGSATLHYSAT